MSKSFNFFKDLVFLLNFWYTIRTQIDKGIPMSTDKEATISDYKEFKKEFNRAKLLVFLVPVISSFIAFSMGYFFETINLKTQLVAAFITFGIIGFFCTFNFLMVYYIDAPVIKRQYKALIKTR